MNKNISIELQSIQKFLVASQLSVVVVSLLSIVLGMLAAGDTPEILLKGYPWLEPEDIQACLVYAYRIVGRERVVPRIVEA